MDSSPAPKIPCLADLVTEMEKLYTEGSREVPEWYKKPANRRLFFLEALKVATTDFLDFLQSLNFTLFEVSSGFRDEETYLWLHDRGYIMDCAETLCHAASIGLVLPFTGVHAPHIICQAPEAIFIAACQGGNPTIFRIVSTYTPEACDASMGALGYYGHTECIKILCDSQCVPIACLEQLVARGRTDIISMINVHKKAEAIWANVSEKSYLMAVAICAGQYETFRHLVVQNWDIDIDVLEASASAGFLEGLTLAFKRNVPLSLKALIRVVDSKSPECLSLCITKISLRHFNEWILVAMGRVCCMESHTASAMLMRILLNTGVEPTADVMQTCQNHKLPSTMRMIQGVFPLDVLDAHCRNAEDLGPDHPDIRQTNFPERRHQAGSSAEGSQVHRLGFQH